MDEPAQPKKSTIRGRIPSGRLSSSFKVFSSIVYKELGPCFGKGKLLVRNSVFRR